MKIILAIFILMISALMSINSIKQIKNQTKFIKQCILMIENISIYLEYNSLSIQEIFQKLLNNESLYLLTFIKEIFNKNQASIDFNTAYKSCLISRNCNYISNDNTELLLGFFSLLGKSDLNGQIANCLLYKALFERELEIVEKNEREKSKICLALYLGAGLCLSILIL